MGPPVYDVVEIATLDYAGTVAFVPAGLAIIAGEPQIDTDLSLS
jgi:hypothetical protein